MDKRNKAWRRKQEWRVWKTRLVYEAASRSYFFRNGALVNRPPHWFELKAERWSQKLKRTGTPCSCWLCSGEKYSRLDFKKETRRILRETWK